MFASHSLLVHGSYIQGSPSDSSSCFLSFSIAPVETLYLLLSQSSTLALVLLLFGRGICVSVYELCPNTLRPIRSLVNAELLYLDSVPEYYVSRLDQFHFHIAY